MSDIATPTGPNPAAAFRGARLHIVTGKGGVGKTTAAAALALCLAAGGKKVLLCEVEGRQATARLFGVSELGYTEDHLAAGVSGGYVKGLAVEPRAALMDYLDTFYMLGSQAGKILDSLGAVEFATTLAPGLRDVLLTGKIYEAAGRTTKQRRGRPAELMYDAVVVDAPPTGRITRFLNVSSEVTDLAKIGPIHNQAASMERMMKAESTRVHLVTLCEEMPVQETIDGIAELTEAGFGIGAIFANRVRTPFLSDDDTEAVTNGTVDAARVCSGAKAAGVDCDDELAAGLIAAGQHHARRLRVQSEQLDRLEELGLPILSLPTLPGGIDRAAVEVLAEELTDQGAL